MVFPDESARGDRPRSVTRGRLAMAFRGPGGRVTNLALLVALLLAFATGVGAVASGSSGGRWVVIAHGVVAMAVVVLVPWKGRVVRRGLRRARHTRWLSLLLAVLAVTTLLTGIGSTTGLVRSVAGALGMWIHIAAALALLPLVVWHVLARRARPRRADLSRRTLIRAGLFAGTAAGLYLAQSAVVSVAGLPGAGRRFTGSYEAGSFDPDSMPSYIWLDDTTPTIDPQRWRLTVSDGSTTREVTLRDLSAFDTRVRATLDCTSGWYAEQDWAGAPVRALLPHTGHARSLLVHSTTGYWIRFPVRDLDHLLLATTVNGTPLRPGHGFPVRLVAPGRRGFWWVKWIDRIELTSTPWWWQPPFPLT
ncbi:MAG: molybdopterin-dependent oxidoreductase [Actinophytocola sp.]|uniref:molybdopterin-dependent oxidoreductase n=1 Tax=Actinophytocola sp. TaxID=1872138 RepID=UPI001320B951|nr:molybdopterin-dependent oxidoreductase [Actinophytocola sp.]MPZ86360.1 molybdopterin-dependent oxidoreductase [Actinophytocola sp.]